MPETQHQKCDGRLDCTLYRSMKETGEEGSHDGGIDHCWLCCIDWLRRSVRPCEGKPGATEKEMCDFCGREKEAPAPHTLPDGWVYVGVFHAESGAEIAADNERACPTCRDAVLVALYEIRHVAESWRAPDRKQLTRKD